ncbi:MAG: biotin/lipoyl-binding protein [Sphingomonadaceae bacterium]|nr:biotin/lipoyl-binding protein [Sphingomonadaceae bacterium]
MADDIETEDDAQTRKRLSPRARMVLLLGVVTVAIAALIWFVDYQTRGKYLAGTDDAYIRADAVTASPKVSGYVDEVFVADNQDVKAGQPLVRIDARDYKAQTAQYQAQIDVAQANADNVRAGIREQEAAIDQSRAQLAANRSDAAFAASQVTRYVPLAENSAAWARQ